MRNYRDIADMHDQEAAGRVLFTQLDTVIILDQQMRQSNDMQYLLAKKEGGVGGGVDERIDFDVGKILRVVTEDTAQPIH